MESLVLEDLGISLWLLLLPLLCWSEILVRIAFWSLDPNHSSSKMSTGDHEQRPGSAFCATLLHSLQLCETLRGGILRIVWKYRPVNAELCGRWRVVPQQR